MDEVDSGRIRIGQQAKVTVDSHPGRTLRGPRRARRSLRARPRAPEPHRRGGGGVRRWALEGGNGSSARNTQGGFLAGTSADVELIVEAREPVLRIPTAALLEGGRVLVFEDGLLAERELEIGLRNWDFVEVRSGLSAGELVVVSLDRKEVKAGKKARLADEGGTGAAR